MSSEHPHLQQQSQHQRPAHRAETTKPTSKTGTRSHLQQQSQHQCQVHINTYNKRSQHQCRLHIRTSNNIANINVEYTCAPVTTEPTSVSSGLSFSNKANISTHSYQQQQSQHQGPVHSHTSNNKATPRGRSCQPLKLSCIILTEVEIDLKKEKEKQMSQADWEPFRVSWSQPAWSSGCPTGTHCTPPKPHKLVK